MLTVVSSHAGLNYSTDFKGSEDALWTEGGSVGSGADWDGDWRIKTYDLTGDGVVHFDQIRSAEYSISHAQGTSFGAGETLDFTIELGGITAGNDWTEGFVLGLSADGETAGPTVGVDVFCLGNGTFLLNDITATGKTGGYGTGVSWGLASTAFNLSITKSATADEFNVSASVAGDTGAGFSYTLTDAELYADSEVFASMTFGRGDKVGLIELDSFSVIPEPATLGMIVASGVSIIFIRRRIMM
ncbi:hypothetical protein SCARR_00931 [Pontiella sulfatireligans]|uniref:PEP-CTERM protein-sorting domain-containing protein n=2 Tax=Pontiella sulfatireligans TaxID=2750658 RepID=A0A6C2UFI9_9BACT|nr:hypothetical protein SCARR_00931 [Pontiella sulfatireligans]